MHSDVFIYCLGEADSSVLLLQGCPKLQSSHTCRPWRQQVGFGLTAPQEVMSSTRRFLCIIALPHSWASEGPLNWVMLLIKPFNKQHIGDRSGLITTDLTDVVMCNMNFTSEDLEKLCFCPYNVGQWSPVLFGQVAQVWNDMSKWCSIWIEVSF